jgi:hypothetical protein
VRKDWRNPPDWFTDERYAHLRKLGLADWQYEIQRCDSLKNGEPGRWRDRSEVPSFIGSPIVQFVPKGELTLHRLEKPALIVQLDAPDGVIIEKFREALEFARRDCPAPVKRPGPKAPNAEFTKKQISTWLNYKIVQLSELDNWREELKKEKRTAPLEADFGRWLFSEHSDPSKEIVTARKALSKAVASIPALWAQVEGTRLEVVTDN